MSQAEKIEQYLVSLSLSYEKLRANAWLVNDEERGLANLLVMIADSLVVLRVKVMDAPGKNREAFFEELLRLNARDLVHGAYALEENSVLLLDTLELDTLDLEEFRASVEAIGLALAQHYPSLSKYRR